jgi:hypothetical protein
MCHDVFPYLEIGRNVLAPKPFSKFSFVPVPNKGTVFRALQNQLCGFPVNQKSQPQANSRNSSH